MYSSYSHKNPRVIVWPVSYLASSRLKKSHTLLNISFWQHEKSKITIHISGVSQTISFFCFLYAGGLSKIKIFALQIYGNTFLETFYFVLVNDWNQMNETQWRHLYEKCSFLDKISRYHEVQFNRYQWW